MTRRPRHGIWFFAFLVSSAAACVEDGPIRHQLSTPDAGAGDGEPGSSDAGSDGADAGGDGIADAAPDSGCRERTPPPLPETWPFGRNKADYQTQFWNDLPDRQTCGLGGCHGVTAIRRPLIPALETELDDPNVLELAIREIYLEVLPSTPPDATAPVSNLLFHHRQGGGERAQPEYSALQTTYLQGFVDRAKACGWKPIAEREMTSGPACDATGFCDCPLPALDLTACVATSTSP